MAKGLSPLVATVLLIALTMTISALLAYWTSTFVRGGLPEKEHTQALEKCAASDFEVYSQSYNSTTQVFKIILQNTGNYDLKITNLTVVYPDNSIITKSIEKTLPKSGILALNFSDISPGYSNYTIFTECPNIYLTYGG